MARKDLSASSPFDATIDSPIQSVDKSLPPAPNPRDGVRIIEGSGPKFADEVSKLLQGRLRISALMFSMTFGAFLIWHTYMVCTPAGNVLLYGFHVAITVFLIASTYSLWTDTTHSRLILRIHEAIIFGIPCLFFAFLQLERMRRDVESLHYVAGTYVGWTFPLFAYAIFIPNHWRRGLIVVALMGIAPILVTLFAYFQHPIVAEILNSKPGTFAEMFLTQGALIALCGFGVHAINTLRVEVFNAKQLGNYHLGRLLGRGGMGEVYLAEHRTMKRPCAIKLIRPEKAGDSRALIRFEREVQSTAKLSHWNTVDIYDYGRSDDGVFYYVMEYLPGLSLQEIVQQHGPMSPERVIFLVRQACDALREAHRLGIVHRDIKPANIFVAKRGGVYDVLKLLDFGLAVTKRNLSDGSDPSEGSIVGSPLYLSPEQASGSIHPDARSDIYSVGAVLYFLLTGQPPFVEDSAAKVILGHLTKEPLAPSQIQPSVPSDLERIVMRCLSKKPEDRFENVDELANALDSCAANGGWNRALAEVWWRDNVESIQPLEEADELVA